MLKLDENLRDKINAYLSGIPVLVKDAPNFIAIINSLQNLEKFDEEPQPKVKENEDAITN